MAASDQEDWCTAALANTAGLAFQPVPSQYWISLLSRSRTLTPWICTPGWAAMLASTISSTSVPLATVTAERDWPP